MQRHLLYCQGFLLLLLALAGCSKDDFLRHGTPGTAAPATGKASLGERVTSQDTRKVLLLYAAGFNTLSSYLTSNISELEAGYIPEGNLRSSDVLLVFSHLAPGGFNKPTAPVLVQYYRQEGVLVKDTVRTWSAGTPVTTAPVLNEVLSYVKDQYPARSYGMIFSSHATGWLPEGYFTSQKEYEGTNRGGISWARPHRSIGQEYRNGKNESYEMGVEDMAAAIPMHLDYLMFDACLLACAEVAYAFREVCDQIVFSPTEILAYGFDYTTLTGHLLGQETPDVVAVAKDYFARYADGVQGGATITCINTQQMDRLAAVCAPLFARYRESIRTLDGTTLQRYDRTLSGKNYYCFFDLYDLLAQAGMTEEEGATLQEALDACVTYKDYTNAFLSIRINRYCGLSLYLPARPDGVDDLYHGTAFLDQYYKENLRWNDAVQLVL